MTLVIGIKCGNGIVIGADSMATLGGAVTVQQNNSKIRVYDKNVIVGISGSHGMSQIELDSLKDHWETEVATKPKNEAKIFISQTAFASTLPYINLSKNMLNGQVDQNLFTGLLVAAAIRKEPVLLSFNEQKSVIEADDSIFFLTQGSGASMATPFLKFIDRVFWEGKPPRTIDDGVFGVLWALHHVIETNATMGVGGDANIAVLDKSENEEWGARALRTEELLEHQERVFDAEETIRDFTRGLFPDLDANE